MNALSAIIRVVCGLVLIILAGSVFLRTRAAVAAGGLLQLFGYTTAADSWQIILGFITIGLIGLVMLIVGVRSFLQSSR